MSGKRNSYIRLVSAYLSQRIKSPRLLRKVEELAFVKIYKDYSDLKFKYPVNKVDYLQAKYQLRRIKRYGKMAQRNSDMNGANTDTNVNNDDENQSRRQRLWGLARTTRDVYIPRFTGSVSQLASGVSSRIYYDEEGKLKVPPDATITLFPTYTRKADDGKYHIDVGGWLYCPGLMTRKNRLIFSLIKQIIRYDSTHSANQAISNLESDNLQQDILNDQGNNSDNESIESDSSLNLLKPSTTSNSSRPASSISNNGEETLKDRLSYFIARFISNAELTIVIGSEDSLDTNQVKSFNVMTDDQGCFNNTVIVDYKPSVIQVMATQEEKVFACQEVMFVPNYGVGVISDIDDTIKLTGVIGNKRDLLTSLLLNDVHIWNIPPVVKWFSSLIRHKNISFHYVSNSPWQLFPTLLQYFTSVGLPPGSMHLKHYTGNIISSLMEPSTSRKKTSLHKILKDFPEKKFICVGDSGEYDFESYVDLARCFPSRILAIYIRYVPNSLSNVDDMKILNELNRMLDQRKLYRHKLRRNTDTDTSSTTSYESSLSESSIEDLIDLSDAPVQTFDSGKSKDELKSLPKIPKKPMNLKGNYISRAGDEKDDSEKEEVDDVPPPLPKRGPHLQGVHTDTDLINHNTPKPQIPKPITETALFGKDNNINRDELLDNLQNIYYSHNFDELRDYDELGAEWIERTMSGIKALENVDTVVRFFTDEDGNLYDTSYEMIKEIIEKS